MRTLVLLLAVIAHAAMAQQESLDYVHITIAADSLEQSRAYNQQHYVWAGSKSREDYAVIFNYKGRKPFGAPVSKVPTYVTQ
jgi:hypothetical protein